MLFIEYLEKRVVDNQAYISEEKSVYFRTFSCRSSYYGYINCWLYIHNNALYLKILYSKIFILGVWARAKSIET